MLVPLVSAGTALFPTIRRAGIQLEKQYFYTLFRIEEHLMVMSALPDSSSPGIGVVGQLNGRPPDAADQVDGAVVCDMEADGV
ncbi:hypothetical protein V6N12_050404 [Hibiscus sabdariffa]|uniref:Uncharacterized protein n=1 Tax=Hibiscus sabdariffa TaxID=183260 RepID=A0ABR2GD77_9ROSI